MDANQERKLSEKSKLRQKEKLTHMHSILEKVVFYLHLLYQVRAKKWGISVEAWR